MGDDLEDLKRVRSGDNVKRLIGRFEAPRDIGKLPKARTASVSPLHIPIQVIQCLDDICRKESSKYRK